VNQEQGSESAASGIGPGVTSLPDPMKANDGIVVPAADDSVVLVREVPTELGRPGLAQNLSQLAGRGEVGMPAVERRPPQVVGAVSEEVEHVGVV
jgi:hypothetical protein